MPNKPGWYRATIEDVRQEVAFSLREATIYFDGKEWGGLVSFERVIDWKVA